MVGVWEGVGNGVCGVVVRGGVDVWDRGVVVMGRKEWVGNGGVGW